MSDEVGRNEIVVEFVHDYVDEQDYVSHDPEYWKLA